MNVIVVCGKKKIPVYIFNLIGQAEILHIGEEDDGGQHSSPELEQKSGNWSNVANIGNSVRV